MTAPSQEIRASIEETRERISHDLDEIGERLNPHNVKEDIKEGIREATIGRVEDMAREAGQRLNQASSGLVQTIKDNPVPAVIAGVGIAWLFLGQSGGSARASGQAGTVDKAKEKVSDIADQAQEAVASAATPKIEATRSAFEENPLAIAAGVVALGRVLGDVGERVVDRVSAVARDTTEKAQHVVERVVEETKVAARDEGLTSGGSQTQSSSL
jgi:tetrahydromethanopterin S-methyltransferase subunit F